MQCPRHSPWGRIDHQKTIAPGIVEVSTPSHGGVWLSPERNALVPENARRPDGWYEEDCQWSVVVLSFPDLWPSQTVEQARCIAKNWLPHAYTAITGEELGPEDSNVLLEEAFRHAHRERFVGFAAYGDWKPGVPAGHVLVVGRRLSDGAQSSLVVPVAAYEQREGFGYVFPA